MDSLPDDQVEPDFREEILAEQVKSVYDVAHIGLIATFINSSIIFVVLRDIFPIRALMGWFAATIIVAFVRTIQVIRFRKVEFQPASASMRGRYFIRGLIISGILWGSLGLFPISSVELAYQLLIAFVLGGMSAGAASTFSALKGGYAAFSIPALVPLAIRFFMMEDAVHYAMGGMLSLFGILLWRVSLQGYRMNKASLLLRFENRGMIRRLMRAKEHADELNRELRTEVEAKLKAEEELRAHQNQLERTVEERTSELRALNRELEAFSYSVAHDLRDPLIRMEGFSDILIREYRDSLSEEAKDLLDRIQKSARKMNGIINDLLRLSKIVRQELSIVKVDLSRMVDDIARELSAKEPERNVEFIIKPGVELRSDYDLLKIAMENLIGNAWKFTSRVASARIDFGIIEIEGKKTYYLRDNGIGFDSEQSAVIFTPFQRLHSDREFPGTGIGLATASRIVKKLGGEIWAEGEPGKGATFYFRLTQNA